MPAFMKDLILSHISDSDLEHDEVADNICNLVDYMVDARVQHILAAVYGIMNDDQTARLVRALRNASMICHVPPDMLPAAPLEQKV